MSSITRALLLAIATAVGTALILNLALGLMGMNLGGLTSFVLPVIAGVAVFSGVYRNKPEAKADDVQREAALASPPAGQARLIVVRQGFISKLMGVDVIVNGQTATQLVSPRFAALTLSPGRHSIEAEGAQAARTAPLVVDLAPGEVAVVDITASVGKLSLSRRSDAANIRTELARIPMVAT